MKRFICLVILFIFLIIMYALYVEPYNLTIHEYSIKNDNIPHEFNGLKIAHLSDILYKDKNDYQLIEKAFSEINSLKPDVIFFTGDLINGKVTKEDENNINKLLTTLKAKLYKYAILGDKDTTKTREILENNNFIILDNTSTLLFNEGTEPILIAGGNKLNDDVLIKDENITYNYKIALIHKPDEYDKIKNDYNLVLAGHSLGGKIRIPYVGATIKKSGSHKYTDNHYETENSEMYVSFGIGTDGYKYRF